VDILITLIAIVWLCGWVKTLATMMKINDSLTIKEMKSTKEMSGVAFVCVFMWPYFHFYMKA